MIWNETLPFSNVGFFYFMATAVLVGFLAKIFLLKWLPYKWFLVAMNAFYLGFLFPKPLQLLGLIVYLYIVILALRKWYRSLNIVFPMVALAVPLFVMKTVNIFPKDSSSDLILQTQHIIQIAGLSYIVFKAISLYIDERKNSNQLNFIAFFNFTAFVPTLLIGPIDRFQRFNTDVSVGYENIQKPLLTKGWNNFTLGLLYKFILAEAIRKLILVHLINDGSFVYHLSYMYTYLVYLFFDFAGYSLLAISFGNFLGINVPINFDKPFAAVNPKEFWKKWHKTLGDWLGDYFFKPLFKDFTSRKILNSIQRQNLALFLTFSLMGFWNGFELHYILSGMLFGCYSALHNYYIYRCKKAKRDVLFGSLAPKYVRIISIFLMVNGVALAIYIFSGNFI